MKKRSERTASIRRPEQIRALASPLRQEILDTLESAGPCSIAQLGEHLGRAADTLYFHVRHLLRTKLVIERERKQVGRHVFATYDLVARPMRIDRLRASREDMLKVAGGILRLALRDFGRGFHDPNSVFDGSGRNHCVARVQGFLDTDDLRELNERFDSLLEFVRSREPQPGRIPIALSFSFTPITARRKVSRTKATPKESQASKHSAAARNAPGRRSP